MIILGVKIHVSRNSGFAFDPNIDEFIDIADLLERKNHQFYVTASLRFTNTHPFEQIRFIAVSQTRTFIGEIVPQINYSFRPFYFVKNILNKDRNLLRYIE